MLRQRVITAVVLLAVLLPALFYPGGSGPFAVLTLVLMGAAGWEWARLCGVGGAAAGALGAGLALALGGVWWRWGGVALPAAVWWAATAGWVVLLALVLRQGVDAWGAWPRGVRVLVGVAALTLAWWAMVTLHTQGVAVLLGALLLVWVADIAAYFGGRAWGRRKLAPTISPGKTWAGAVSGAAAVLALAWLWTWAAHWPTVGPWLADGFYASLGRGGAAGALAWLMLLTALSIAGDLFESLVKRSAGVKDSSGLLPGHGGVLDRIDALLPVLPAALAALTWQGG